MCLESGSTGHDPRLLQLALGQRPPPLYTGVAVRDLPATPGVFVRFVALVRETLHA